MNIHFLSKMKKTHIRKTHANEKSKDDSTRISLSLSKNDWIKERESLYVIIK